MSKKQKIKVCIDLAMTTALPILICYSLIGETAHEIIGVTMFCLFIAHHILNIGWIKSLFKGKYTIQRIVGTAINALVLVCMLGLMYSAVVISKHIFAFAALGGTMTARTIHLLCAYWGLILMSIHLGMHIEQMLKLIKLKSSKPLIALYIIFGILAVVGIYVFIKLKFAYYMFGRVQFVFIDSSAAVILTILEYLCVMVLFAEIGYWLNKAVKKKEKND